MTNDRGAAAIELSPEAQDTLDVYGQIMGELQQIEHLLDQHGKSSLDDLAGLAGGLVAVAAAMTFNPMVGVLAAMQLGNTKSSHSSPPLTPFQKRQQKALLKLQNKGYPVQSPKILNVLLTALREGDVGALAGWLRDGISEEWRRGAAAALGELGTGAAPIASVIVHAVQNDGSAVVRLVAIRALGKFALDNVSVNAALDAALTRDDDERVQFEAGMLLAQKRRRLSTVIPLLIEVLGQPVTELTDGHSNLSRATRMLVEIGDRVLPDLEAAIEAEEQRNFLTRREKFISRANAVRDELRKKKQSP